MVKTDDHMERIRQKLLDERAGLKASEDAKKQRELKKFGKQVQVAKLQERAKAKKQQIDQVKDIKRKRARNDANLDDQFVVEADVDASPPSKKSRGLSIKDKRNTSGSGRMPRQARDKKYGFKSGGRRDKSLRSKSKRAFRAKKRTDPKSAFAQADQARIERLSSKLQRSDKISGLKSAANDMETDQQEEDVEGNSDLGEGPSAIAASVDDNGQDLTSNGTEQTEKRISTSGTRTSTRSEWRERKGTAKSKRSKTFNFKSRNRAKDGLFAS